MMSAVVTVEAGLMAAVERARDLAMDRAARAPIPWCGDFAGIAQDLDAALRAAAPKGEPVEIGKGPCAINGLPDQSSQKEISPAPASASSSTACARPFTVAVFGALQAQCATEGCTERAIDHIVSGNVGSDFCCTCSDRIQAASAHASGNAEGGA